MPLSRIARARPRGRAAAVIAVIAVLATACGGGGGEPGAVPAAAEPIAVAPDVPQAAATDPLGGEPFLHRNVDREAPGFTLIDQDGNQFRLADLAGKWVLIDWVFTNCATFCPILTGEMHVVRNGLGDAVGTDVHFVSITFDPTRDTPEALKAYATLATGGAAGWTWLTGTQEQTGAVAAAYGVSFDPSEPVGGVAQFDHTSLMVVVGPDGRERHRYLGVGWAKDVIERLSAEMAAPPVAAAPTTIPAEPVVAPAAVSPGVTDLLAEAIALPFEDFELEPGVRSQVLYQFPSSGALVTFVDVLSREAADQGIEVKRSSLSAMTARLISWSDDRVAGVGYTNNLAIVVEAESTQAALAALSVVDNEWCCGTPGA